MKRIITVFLMSVLCLSMVGCGTKKENNVTKDYKVDDLKKISDDVHAKVEKKPFVQSSEIDIKDKDLLMMSTGLKSEANVESVVVTEASIGAQAYSFVLVKVTDTSKINEMKKEMLDNIDLSKWICAFADKVYVTDYGNLIMLVMGDTKIVDVDAIYNEFEKISNNNLGKKLERLGEK